MKHFYFLALVSLLLLPATFGVARAQDSPNIVFILADDMSFDSVSANNDQIGEMKTPNIDKLIAEGMNFTDAHSGSSVCTPTRYGLLTGRYCWRSKLKNSVLWEYATPLIEPERLTVAQMLQRKGYRTGIVGKWHLGMEWRGTDGEIVNANLEITDAGFRKGDPGNRIRDVAKNIDFSKPITGGPTDRGFDYFWGMEAPNFPPYIWMENDRVQGDPSVSKPRDMFGHPGPMLPGWKLEEILPTLALKAGEWISQESKNEQPFFLYVPLTSPHTPISPSERFLGISGISDYADFVIETDAVVGQILDSLEQSGAADNTLVIFSTDNGTAGTAKFSKIKKLGVNLQNHFRGRKAQIYEGGHRVPFVVRWPGKVKPGSVCHEIICLNDFMATAAEIVDFKLPENSAQDSTSILPLITSEQQTLPDRPLVVNHDIKGQFAIRKGNWKLIENSILYDLAADPKETTDVAASNPEVVAELSDALERCRSAQP